MKNKLFWPIAIVAIVIMIESVMLMSDKKINKQESNPINGNLTEEIVTKEVINFSWINEETNKPILIMTANKKMAIDAIDLYIAYKGVKVNSVENLGELPKPSFSKVSTEKSLVVMNYLIADTDGFNIEEGQSIRVAQFGIKLDPTKTAELSIDSKTQVVENGTVKVLPFNSKSLIVNSVSL